MGQEPTSSGTKNQAMLDKEQELGEPLEVVLQRLYYDEDLTLLEVGDRLGVHESTVWRWIRKCGLAPVKRPAERPA